MEGNFVGMYGVEVMAGSLLEGVDDNNDDNGGKLGLLAP